MMPYDSYRLYQTERRKSAAEIRRADEQIGQFAAAASALFRSLTRPSRVAWAHLRDSRSCAAQCTAEPARPTGDRDPSAGGETHERSISNGCSPTAHDRATKVFATGSARQAIRERRLL